MSAPSDYLNGTEHAASRIAQLADLVVTLCAWCGHVERTEPAQPDYGWGLNHTMCAQCAERMEAGDAR